MGCRRPWTTGVVGLAMVIGMASGAAAERLFVPGPGLRAARPLRGVARVRTLALERAALVSLRARRDALVTEFPLGSDRTASLRLSRFEPFTPGVRVEVVEEGGVRPATMPDHVYFTGTIDGDPTSRVLLVAGRDTARGFVVSGGRVYPFGPDGGGGYRSYALDDADPDVYPAPAAFCTNGRHPTVESTPGASARRLAGAGLGPAPVLRAAPTLLEAEVAIETDYELWAGFATNQATLDYLASLAAAASAITERDVALRLRFSYIRIWSTPSDPWTATGSSDQLDEVQGYWTNPQNNMNAIAGPRDLVHFVSGKQVEGGIAYLDAVCDQYFGFGVSQVDGHFDLSSPYEIWDVLVVTHELGHNIGSPHTHCYTPAVDRCYNQEDSCYAGSVVPTRGTIMSYCHLLAGGLSNIDLEYGSVVSSRIRATVDAASCLEPASSSGGSCGNGALEAGEQCDDGNTTGGDGCGPTCRREVCGNAIVDPGEQCDDGNMASGDGCSAGCAREAFCGDGTAGPGEECDDGNTASGDGCSPTCRREPCVVLRSAQTIWPVARVMVQRGAAGDHLSVRAWFGLPVAVDTLAPQADGLRLMLENASGTMKVDVTLPPGARWTARQDRWIYRDSLGTVAGIRRLVLRNKTVGGLPEVDLNATGRGTSYPLAPEDLPLALTVVLGDAADGQAGACGHYAFGGGSCAAIRRGSRLVCN